MQPQRLLSLSTVAIILIIAVATGSISTASAQEGDRAEQLEERLAEARTRLNLTDDQIEQVRPILRAGIKEGNKVLEKHGIDIRDRSGEPPRLGFRQLQRLGRELDDVREQMVEDLEDVLTDDQIKEFKEILKERKSAMRKRLRERGL